MVVSKIYYLYEDEQKERFLWWKKEDIPFRSFQCQCIQTGVLLFLNLRYRTRIIESDIAINGSAIEKNQGCMNYLTKDDLMYLSTMRKEDRCTIAYFMATMIHEMGHALGLRHNIENALSIMHIHASSRERLNRAQIFKTGKLHQDDIDAFNELYNIEKD